MVGASLTASVVLSVVELKRLRQKKGRGVGQIQRSNPSYDTYFKHREGGGDVGHWMGNMRGDGKTTTAAVQ